MFIQRPPEEEQKIDAAAPANLDKATEAVEAARATVAALDKEIYAALEAKDIAAEALARGRARVAQQALWNMELYKSRMEA